MMIKFMYIKLWLQASKGLNCDAALQQRKEMETCALKYNLASLPPKMTSTSADTLLQGEFPWSHLQIHTLLLWAKFVTSFSSVWVLYVESLSLF